MTDINIAGTAAVVGPEDHLVITLPRLISDQDHDEFVTNLRELLKDSPLAGRVLVLSDADTAVVKPGAIGHCVSCPNRDPRVGKPAHPPTSESGVSAGPDGAR